MGSAGALFLAETASYRGRGDCPHGADPTHMPLCSPHLHKLGLSQLPQGHQALDPRTFMSSLVTSVQAQTSLLAISVLPQCQFLHHPISLFLSADPASEWAAEALLLLLPDLVLPCVTTSAPSRIHPMQAHNELGLMPSAAPPTQGYSSGHHSPAFKFTGSQGDTQQTDSSHWTM